MPKPANADALNEAGAIACRTGKPRASCPYTKRAMAASPERREWLKGYDNERHGGPQAHDQEAA